MHIMQIIDSSLDKNDKSNHRWILYFNTKRSVILKDIINTILDIP